MLTHLGLYFIFIYLFSLLLTVSFYLFVDLIFRLVVRYGLMALAIHPPGLCYLGRVLIPGPSKTLIL